MNRKILSVCLVAVVAGTACGKGKSASTPIPGLSGISFKSPLSKEQAYQAFKVLESLKSEKAGSFRGEDVAGANQATLGFISGGNFAEAGLGFAMGSDELVKDSLRGFTEMAKRGGNVGGQGTNLNWVSEVNAILSGIENKSLTQEQAGAQFLELGTKFASAASEGGDQDFAIHTMVGMATYSAAVSMMAGDAKSAASLLEPVEQYMNAYGSHLSPSDKSALKDAITAAREPGTKEALKSAGRSLYTSVHSLRII